MVQDGVAEGEFAGGEVGLAFCPVGEPAVEPVFRHSEESEQALGGQTGGVDAGGTQLVQESAATVVLGGCDLLEVVGAVVGRDAVDVVDLHTGCTLADPCFVDKDVTGLTTKVPHEHILRVSTCFLGRSVRRVIRFNLINRAARNGEESSVAGAVELRVSASGFGVAAEAEGDSFVDELRNGCARIGDWRL